MGRSPAAIPVDGVGLTPGDLAFISHVPCSCYPYTWTPCILKKLWKRRSWSE